MHSGFIETFLTEKGLDPDILDDPIEFSYPIEQHAAWFYRNILSKPYLRNRHNFVPEAPRFFHGMAHACRVALYIPVLTNIFTLLSSGQTPFSENTLKKAQICMLMHDLMREDDGKDEWDLDSALFCYFYMKKLKFPLNECRYWAEAVANRDSGDAYFKLCFNDRGPLWKSCPSQDFIHPHRTMIMQGADCYDIFRANPFDIEYLHLFEYFQDNDLAFTLLTHLGLEIRSFIAKHGDSYLDQTLSLKKSIECENGFLASQNLLNNPSLFLLSTFYNNGLVMSRAQLQAFQFPDEWKIPYDPALGMDEHNIQAALREGKILARGFLLPPSALHEKPQTIGDVEHKRSFARVENEKARRRRGVITSSSKPNAGEKHKNPARSVVPLAEGIVPAACTGYFIVNPDMEEIQSVHHTNEKTGYGKKMHFFEHNRRPSTEEIEQTYQQVLRKEKMGGMATHSGFFYPFLHPEITYNIGGFDGIYICDHPLAFNLQFSKSHKIKNKLSLLLQAYYLRLEYQHMHGVSLPIFDYSPTDFCIKKIPETALTEDKITEYWTIVALEYYKELWQKALDLPSRETIIQPMANILKMSLATLKINAVYNPQIPYKIAYQSADENYSPELRNRINKALTIKLDEYLNELNITHPFCENIYLLMAAASNEIGFLKR